MKGENAMDVTVITNLIGSIGFPIVMALLLFTRMNKQDELHKEEMMKLTESVNNNTIALTQLSTKLDLKGNANE